MAECENATFEVNAASERVVSRKHPFSAIVFGDLHGGVGSSVVHNGSGDRVGAGVGAAECEASIRSGSSCLVEGGIVEREDAGAVVVDGAVPVISGISPIANAHLAIHGRVARADELQHTVAGGLPKTDGIRSGSEVVGRVELERAAVDVDRSSERVAGRQSHGT